MIAHGTGLADSEQPLLQAYDAVFLDLDGVVYVGEHAVPGVREAMAAITDAGLPVAFLTNNASRTAAEVAEHLSSFDIGEIAPEQVVTSAQAIAQIAADELPAGAPVLVVGGPGLIEPLTALGLTVVDSADANPAAVVQGFHASVGWPQLAEASFAIQRGARWYASNDDLTFPVARGLAPGNGSLIQTIANATGKRPVIAGKPHAPVFDEARRRFNCERPIMVGDRLDTDIDGAIAAGIPVLAVLSGVCSLSDFAAAPVGHRPDYIAADIRGLLEPQLPVGSVVDPAEGSTDALRAALASAWPLEAVTP